MITLAENTIAIFAKLRVNNAKGVIISSNGSWAIISSLPASPRARQDDTPTMHDYIMCNIYLPSAMFNLC